jgi:hypothetical protein
MQPWAEAGTQGCALHFLCHRPSIQSLSNTRLLPFDSSMIHASGAHAVQKQLHGADLPRHVDTNLGLSSPTFASPASLSVADSLANICRNIFIASVCVMDRIVVPVLTLGCHTQVKVGHMFRRSSNAATALLPRVCILNADP